MSEIEDLEKQLADLKHQREEIETKEKDSVLSKIMDMDYETHGVISNILKKNGNPDPDAETDKMMDRYRDMEKELIRLLGLTEKLQEMLHG